MASVNPFSSQGVSLVPARGSPASKPALSTPRQGCSYVAVYKRLKKDWSAFLDKF
jgi:hypothetical protein